MRDAMQFASLEAALRWDNQVRVTPLQWHPDWLPRGGWPAGAQASSSVASLPAWVAQRLGPSPAWDALQVDRMAPVLCSLDQSVVLLARLALQLRPRQLRHLLTDRQWLHLGAAAHPCVTGQGITLKPIKATAPGLAEWAAVGLHDWAKMLCGNERAAYLLLRRCFPARLTVLWSRRLAPRDIFVSADWATVLGMQEIR